MGTICVLVSFPFLFMPAIGLAVEKTCHNNGTSNGTTPNPSTMSTVSGTSMGTTTSDSGDDDCENEGEMAITAYYSAFVVLFQFGWATVQISHLSMIPEITPSENKRGSLTAIRNVGTAISSMFVYSTTWIMFGIGKT